MEITAARGGSPRMNDCGRLDRGPRATSEDDGHVTALTRLLPQLKSAPGETRCRWRGTSPTRAEAARSRSRPGDSPGVPGRGSTCKTGRGSSGVPPPGRWREQEGRPRLSKGLAENAKKLQSRGKVASCPDQRSLRGEHRAPRSMVRACCFGTASPEVLGCRAGMPHEWRRDVVLGHVARLHVLLGNPDHATPGCTIRSRVPGRSRSGSRLSRLASASQARACRRRLLFVSRGERPRASSPEL